MIKKIVYMPKKVARKSHEDTSGFNEMVAVEVDLYI
jgi:hypothetical protein